ncbi:hypothetical protein JOF53_005597 [Crossiella equi]|uniref:Uncharacterized protein n=1 Tax=Crossiella equi TaxID=130796 RepID=A0ABS5AM03_9PSEU|nr:hypothetical protein [Crossiella equi]MBP2476725.1 hypothetical protein [Crossiella equi]
MRKLASALVFAATAGPALVPAASAAGSFQGYGTGSSQVEAEQAATANAYRAAAAGGYTLSRCHLTGRRGWPERERCAASASVACI